MRRAGGEGGGEERGEAAGYEKGFKTNDAVEGNAGLYPWEEAELQQQGEGSMVAVSRKVLLATPYFPLRGHCCCERADTTSMHARMPPCSKTLNANVRGLYLKNRYKLKHLWRSETKLGHKRNEAGRLSCKRKTQPSNTTEENERLHTL